MALEGKQFKPRRGLPYLQLVVPTPRGESLSIGAPGHYVNETLMALEREQFTPRVHFPNRDRFISARRQLLPIRTPGHAIAADVVAAEGEQFPPRLRLP